VSDGFALAGVVHLVRPVGRRAENLEELRLGIAEAPPTSLFYHAVQCQLRAPDGDELPPDDFSAWVEGVVQDRETAERLSYVVQSAGAAAEPLRDALVATLLAATAASKRPGAAPPGGEFAFLAVDSVAVPTGEEAEDASRLMELLASAGDSVWFHHFVERPWFEPGEPAPVRWLRERDEPRLAEALLEAVRAGRPVATMRRRVAARWRRHNLGLRLAEGARRTEAERAAAGHAAVAGLVRRLKRQEPAP
jgi:Family of unknown function (DUF5752)